MTLVEIRVEEMDIIKEFEFYMDEMRKIAVAGCTNEEKIKAYDLGASNGLKVLKMLFEKWDEPEEPVDRLIYYKHKGHDCVVRYCTLPDALKEIQEQNSHICFHEYEMFENSDCEKSVKFGETEARKAKFKCKKCGKIKEDTFVGYTTGASDELFAKT